LTEGTELDRQDLQKLLHVLMKAAPNGKVQEAIITRYHDAEAQGESREELACMLAGTLLDGLRHGNWTPVLKGPIGIRTNVDGHDI
jgi:hypothetical protein